MPHHLRRKENRKGEIFVFLVNLVLYMLDKVSYIKLRKNMVTDSDKSLYSKFFNSKTSYRNLSDKSLYPKFLIQKPITAIAGWILDQ